MGKSKENAGQLFSRGWRPWLNSEPVFIKTKTPVGLAVPAGVFYSPGYFL